jgi:hypothetical protein
MGRCRSEVAIERERESSEVETEVGDRGKISVRPRDPLSYGGQMLLKRSEAFFRWMVRDIVTKGQRS